MAKILLTIASLLILAFIGVAIYRAIVVAKRSDGNENDGYNSQWDDNTFEEKQICSMCKTGKYTYELDKHSQVCPYISCIGKGKCSFFVPLEKTSKLSVFKMQKRGKTKPMGIKSCIICKN